MCYACALVCVWGRVECIRYDINMWAIEPRGRTLEGIALHRWSKDPGCDNVAHYDRNVIAKSLYMCDVPLNPDPYVIGVNPSA